MVSSTKRGRKRKPYICPWNDQHVDGLYEVKGTNRWRITDGPLAGTEFRENDPHEAVSRFYGMQKRQTIDLVTASGEYQTAEQIDAMIDKWRRTGGTLRSTAAGKMEIVTPVDEAQFWTRVRKELEDRPQYAALMTGIEWLGWHSHQRPEKADTLEDLGQFYLEHNKLSVNELSRSKCFWAEFEKVAQRLTITTVDGITHDLAHKYEAYVDERNLSPKSKLHRYRKIRGILHFAIKRGRSIDHCRKALDVLAMLEVKNAHPLDPTPISPADFWAIYAQAKKAGDDAFAAMLQTALNGALYSGEVAAVRWDEIDFATGGFVSRRSKTGVSRIAMLWPSTLAALKPLPHDRDEVFCTKIRSYTVHSVGDKFETYRDDAGVDKAITFSWIRDAAYSIAMQAGDFAKAEMLSGHRLPGTSDNYLRRNPQLVAVACQAIAKTFDVVGNVKKIAKKDVPKAK